MNDQYKPKHACHSVVCTIPMPHECHAKEATWYECMQESRIAELRAQLAAEKARADTAEAELAAERSGHCTKDEGGLSCYHRLHFNEMCRNCQLVDSGERGNSARDERDAEKARAEQLERDVSTWKECTQTAERIQRVYLAERDAAIARADRAEAMVNPNVPDMLARIQSAIAERDALRARRATARRDALEEAARIADGWASWYPSDVFPNQEVDYSAEITKPLVSRISGSMGRHVSEGIAKDIRALASEDSSDE